MYYIKIHIIYHNDKILLKYVYIIIYKLFHINFVKFMKYCIYKYLSIYGLYDFDVMLLFQKGKHEDQPADGGEGIEHLVLVQSKQYLQRRFYEFSL